MAEGAFSPSELQAIPLSHHQIGSWQIAISRRPRSRADLASTYDALSQRWARTAKRFHLETAYRAPLLASGVRGLVAQTDGQARVLDCGIGCGSLSLALHHVVETPLRYCGVDMSAQMLARASQDLRRAGLTPHLTQADVCCLPYPNCAFDVVMAAHVLEHLPEPQTALKEMARVLKPGGLMVVCMTRRSAFGALVQLAWRTWAITEPQARAWLQACRLTEIGSCPVTLGGWAGQASLAFWAHRPLGPVGEVAR